MAFFDKISKTITSTSKDVAKKTKDLTDTAKLNSQVSAEQKKIEQLQLKIGKIYYDEYKNTPLENLISLCNEVDDAYNKIESYKSQIIEIKGVLPCPECGTELSNESAFCSKCGANVKNYIEEQRAKTSDTQNCPKCNAEITEDMVFCTECGNTLLCSNCQAPVSEGMDFCTECGEQVK